MGAAVCRCAEGEREHEGAKPPAAAEGATGRGREGCSRGLPWFLKRKARPHSSLPRCKPRGRGRRKRQSGVKRKKGPYGAATCAGNQTSIEKGEESRGEERGNVWMHREKYAKRKARPKTLTEFGRVDPCLCPVNGGCVGRRDLCLPFAAFSPFLFRSLVWNVGWGSSRGGKGLPSGLLVWSVGVSRKKQSGGKEEDEAVVERERKGEGVEEPLVTQLQL